MKLSKALQQTTFQTTFLDVLVHFEYPDDMKISIFFHRNKEEQKYHKNIMNMNIERALHRI